jgi:enamine deaminase RidA (YjgF/YER057c/UK114 family)
MQRRELNAPEAPPVATYYSQAVEIGGPPRTLYVSGQVGVDSNGNVAGDFAGQCRQTLLKVLRCLKWIETSSSRQPHVELAGEQIDDGRQIAG